MRRRRASDERGYTLIEMMVVVLLVGVLATIVSTGLITGLQTSRHADDRAFATAQVDPVLDEITRDIRVADPLWSASPTQLIMDNYLSTGVCERIGWQLSGTALQREVTTYAAPNGATSDSSNGCAGYPSTATAVSSSGWVSVVSNLETSTTTPSTATPVFTLLTDAGGAASSAATTNEIAISVPVLLSGVATPAVYATTVSLRNNP
jgi:prepilin-type N-terminal cleavage/methylation domain-containing protein